MSEQEPKDSDSTGTSTQPPSPTPSTTPPLTCEPLPEGEAPPELPEPEPCETNCDCPTGTPLPGGGGSCLEALIADQAKELTKAEHAKSFMAELEALLKAATVAKLAYPRTVYTDLKTRWDVLDQAIVGVIDSVTCAVKCWACLIECEACSQVYAIGDLQTRLDGDGTLMRDVHSLRDLEYWHQGNVAAKTAQFDRFKAVLAAWNSPAATITAALSANEKVVQTIGALGKAEQVLQLFLKIIPLHLAIAPRDVTSRIDPVYIDICACDDGEPDECCGPDAGVLPIRTQYLAGPQPYIVDPDDYFSIICCLVQHRYLPAKDQLAKASADLAAVSVVIVTLKTELDRLRKDILADALAKIGQPLDCDKYGSGCGGPQQPSPQQTQQQKSPPAAPAAQN